MEPVTLKKGKKTYVAEKAAMVKLALKKGYKVVEEEPEPVDPPDPDEDTGNDAGELPADDPPDPDEDKPEE